MSLVDALPPITLVVGKGGVGKTTTACAIARRMGRRESTLLLSTDPARALPLVLRQDVGASATPVPGVTRLRAQVLDATTLRSGFLARWGDALRTILDRGTYLDQSDIAPLVDTALPGTDEIFAALALAELFVAREDDRIIVDTAPTGHTLRLLQLPATFRALVRLLEAMQAKHRFMVRALTRAYRADAADALLAEMNALVSALDGTFRDPARCGALMVLNDQDLVVAESGRYARKLRELGMRIAAAIWNGSLPARLAELEGVPQYAVPRLRLWPVGAKGLDTWMTALVHVEEQRPDRSAPGDNDNAQVSRRAAAQNGSNDIGALIRSLTIVAGKGGVGKTTVACAIGLVASQESRTLIVSTDPAPSLGDAFALPIPDADTPVGGMLFARQMDATAAFERMRATYAARVDALFDGIVAKGVELTHDHAIARDLLALAPPGIDEVYALSLIADALFADRYERVIVDPAPTGHLLRLLEMPALALDWCHQLLRLMLKYKDVAGLGETARDVLEFSKSLRALTALLHDATRAGVVIVAVDEPVVRDESERLATEVRARDVAVGGVVLNRASAAPGDGLPVPDAPVHFVAPATQPPPIGGSALREWARTWTLTPAHADRS